MESLYVYNEGYKSYPDIYVIDIDYLVCPITYMQFKKSDLPFEIYDTVLLNKIKNQNRSIVVTGNQQDIIDEVIKAKVAFLCSKLDKEIFAILSKTRNKFMKPHINAFDYYIAWTKSQNMQLPTDIIVIGHVGYNGDTDIDYAFAHNIGKIYDMKITCMHATEINGLGLGKISKAYTSTLMPPEDRQKYLTTYNANDDNYVLQNIINIVNKHGRYNIGGFVIFVDGQHKSGKSSLVDKLTAQWNKSDLQKRFVLKNIVRKAQYKKLVDTNYSAIIDGNCCTKALREYYIKDIPKRRYIVVYIYIDIGPLYKIFNHCAVEKHVDITLLADKKFDIYSGIHEMYDKSEYANGESIVITYKPEINISVAFNRFRF